MTTNSNIKIFLLCPVPENQKPITEFFNLQENSFINWLTFSKEKFENTLISLYRNFFIIIFLFSFVNSSFSSIFSLFFLSLFTTTISFLFFFFLVYVRWNQLNISFTQSRFFYEEGSWYDGQIWEKPFSILKNDRLLSSQKIQPVLQRLSVLLFRFSLLTFILGISLLEN